MIHIPEHSLERVRAALEGELSALELSKEEQSIFDNLWFERVNTPTEAEMLRFQRYLDEHGRGPEDE